MDEYKINEGEKYSVKSNYGSEAPVMNSTYVSQSNLPSYTNKQEQQTIKKRSRCPRGAILGEIGTCCGLQCTRACALEGE